MSYLFTLAFVIVCLYMSNATDTNYLKIFLQIADVVLVIFK